MIDIAENAAAYFVDRHATSAYRDKFAFVEAGGEQRSLTYGKLAEETGRLAHLLSVPESNMKIASRCCCSTSSNSRSFSGAASRPE